MNSKERVYAAIQHKDTDRIPRFVWLGEKVVDNLCIKLSCTAEQLDFIVGNDVLQTWLSVNGSMARRAGEGETFTDTLGITWKREGYYNMVIKHPLEGLDEAAIKAYPLPDPKDNTIYQKLDELIQKYGSTHFIGADVSGTLFEPAYHLMGMEELMVELITESERASILLDKLENYSAGIAVEAAERGADWIWLGDDLGSQTAMMMSPDLWRQHFKPRMKRIIEKIRMVKPSMPVAYHSCGAMTAVLDDLIEIGVNVINPLQESAKGVNHLEIKQKYGDRITMMCGPDTQSFLLTASPDEVRAEIKQKIKDLGSGGGYIFALSHTLQPDVPFENLSAMYDALGVKI